MRFLNLSSNDYAAMSHNNALALRSLGVHVVDLTLFPHAFGYKSQSSRTTKSVISKIYKGYDCIQIFHSDVQLYNIVKDHPNVVIYHTGTRYRINPKYYDREFRYRKILTDQCEFLLLKKMNYIAPHTILKPTPKATEGKLIIGHYPSNPDVKGTKAIERMLAPFLNDFDIRIDTKKVSHENNLKRVSDCHIYIELFAPTQNGKPYGCFGVSAFESTALGSVVVTNNINRKAYEDVYGHQPFLTPNTEKEFQSIVAGLWDRETYDISKEAMHNGFYQKHGIIETGQRILTLTT